MKRLLPMCFVALAIAAAAEGAVFVVAESKTVASDPVLPTETFVDVYLGIEGTGNGNLTNFTVVASLATNGITFSEPVRTDQSDPVRTQLFPDNWINTSLAHPNSATLAYVDSFGPAIALDSANGLGLMRIPVTIPAGVTGDFVIEIKANPIGNETYLLNMFEEVAFTAVNGTLNVVPEPATFSLIGTAGTILALRRRRQA